MTWPFLYLSVVGEEGVRTNTFFRANYLSGWYDVSFPLLSYFTQPSMEFGTQF